MSVFEEKILIIKKWLMYMQMEVGVGEWKCNYSRPFRKNMTEKPVTDVYWFYTKFIEIIFHVLQDFV